MLFSFLGVALFHVLKHTTYVLNEDGSLDPIEIVATVIEVIQTLEQTVFILVGLKISKMKHSDKAVAPPTELLIHLTAANLSALITGVFLTKMELFKVAKFISRPGNLMDVGLAWSALGSLLLPWQTFFRFYSIICLVEIRKLIFEQFEQPK